MYQLDIGSAFESRLSEVDEKILIRIQQAYARARADQVDVENQYQVSGEWLPIYKQYMDGLIEALLGCRMDSMKEIFSNFFRRPCSAGLHGLHFEMVERYMDKEPTIEDRQVYLNAVKLYVELFLLNCKNIHPSILSRPSVGNPYGYHITDMSTNSKYFIYGGAEYHYYYADRIKMLLDANQSSTVFELGGGFGGLASFLLRDFDMSLYCAIDLPENLALQSYFLMTLFPNKRFGLYGDIDLKNFAEESKKYDVILLPNYCIEFLPENFFSLSYNSYSLAEMGLEVANNYLKYISHITNRYIYHVNHVYWSVSSDNFHIDQQKFNLLFRFPTMWGRDPLRPNIDHHDYIYKKNNF